MFREDAAIPVLQAEKTRKALKSPFSFNWVGNTRHSSISKNGLQYWVKHTKKIHKENLESIERVKNFKTHKEYKITPIPILKKSNAPHVNECPIIKHKFVEEICDVRDKRANHAQTPPPRAKTKRKEWAQQ